MRRPVLTLTASAALLGAVAGYEGYSQQAYKDAVGVPTIGFGTTAGVRPGDRADPVRAVQRLSADVQAHAREAARCIGDVPLYQHEYDAYVSLAYNVGAPAFCGSTLVRKLRADPPDYPGACAELLRWTYAGGKQLPGLVKRRQAEYLLCMEGYPQ